MKTLKDLGIKLEEKHDKLYHGGSLDLEGTGITSLPDNLTVGGYLYLRGTGITNTENINKNISEYSFFQWRSGLFVKVDGVFTKVISKKKNVWKVQRIGSTKETYLITDGNAKYSHGETIQEAKQDLIFKISNRDKSEYENLTLESVLTFEKAIECYRVLTGACSFGTKDFVVNRLFDKKKKYSIAEIIDLTENEYGNSTFKNFFAT